MPGHSREAGSEVSLVPFWERAGTWMLTEPPLSPRRIYWHGVLYMSNETVMRVCWCLMTAPALQENMTEIGAGTLQIPAKPEVNSGLRKGQQSPVTEFSRKWDVCLLLVLWEVVEP